MTLYWGLSGEHVVCDISTWSGQSVVQQVLTFNACMQALRHKD